MINLNSAQMRMKLYPEDKDFLIAWYQSVLNKEFEDYKNNFVVSQDSVFDPKKEKEIAFRTQSNEHESYLADFKKFVDNLPCAYFPMMKHDISRNERDGAILNQLGEYSGATGFLNLIELMSRGEIKIENPDAAIEEYIASHGGKIYSAEELDAELQNDGWAVLSEDDLHNAPEIKESRFYSKKDREIEWKREVMRLENEEKKRIADRKDAQRADKGYRMIHYSVHKFTKEQCKEHDALFSDYAKENKKLETAIDAYHKAKLETDKLKAKRVIMGELSTKEERTYQKYQKTLIDATANLSSVKAKAVQDFKSKLAREGKDPDAPHHQIRLAQLRSADTRYMSFENAEVNEHVYGYVPARLQNEGATAPTPRGRNLDLSSYVPTSTQTPSRDSAEIAPRGIHVEKDPLQKD